MQPDAATQPHPRHGGVPLRQREARVVDEGGQVVAPHLLQALAHVLCRAGRGQSSQGSEKGFTRKRVRRPVQTQQAPAHTRAAGRAWLQPAQLGGAAAADRREGQTQRARQSAGDRSDWLERHSE